MGQTNNNGKKKKEILYIKVYKFITQFQRLDYTLSLLNMENLTQKLISVAHRQYILLRVRIIHENRENNQKMGQTNKSKRTRNGILYICK